MQVLMIIHDEFNRSPGLLGQYFLDAGAEVFLARLHQGDQLPDDAREFDAIVCLGGEMSVHDHEHYPFLREEDGFLKRAVLAGRPLLGVCLGAQMIARALGGEVRPAAVEEIGWSEVELTEAAQDDPLFADLPRKLAVMQWHGDAFELPPGAVLLATGKRCPNQAFRCRQAYGLQFHLEVNQDIVEEWFGGARGKASVVKKYAELEPRLRRNAKRLAANFLDLASRPDRTEAPGLAVAEKTSSPG